MVTIWLPPKCQTKQQGFIHNKLNAKCVVQTRYSYVLTDRQSSVFLALTTRLLCFGFLCFLALSGSDRVLSASCATFSHPSGLDSDESYEGVSESSFKDALVFDSSSQKKNGSVPQENGIRKHRYSCIPALCMFGAVQKLFELVCVVLLRRPIICILFCGF